MDMTTWVLTHPDWKFGDPLPDYVVPNERVLKEGLAHSLAAIWAGISPLNIDLLKESDDD